VLCEENKSRGVFFREQTVGTTYKSRNIDYLTYFIKYTDGRPSKSSKECRYV
jgi:hypothetical protein